MANPKVTVEIDGKDNLTPVVKKATVNLKEMGEKVSQLGMRISAAFTVPIIGAGMALNKFGQDSVKAVNDAAGDLSKLSPEVIKAAEAYKQMQAALAPVNVELDKTKATLLQALVPVIQQLAPMLVQMAQSISNLAMQFAALPVSTQNFIISAIALVAAVGPMVLIIGQVISTVGLLKELFVTLPAVIGGISTAAKGLGVVFGAISAPVIALTAAIAALIYLINSGYAARAWTTLNQLIGIGLYKTGLISADQLRQNMPGRANGGPVSGGSPYIVGERGPELFVPRSSGNIVPNVALSGAGGGGMTFVYSPVISTASQDDIERMGKLIEQALRRRP